MTDKAQTQKEALDALPYYPTEEEAEAALRACGTSGEEIVNEFIERLLFENLRLKEELDNTRARVDGVVATVDAQRIVREWIADCSDRLQSGETMSLPKGALTDLIKRIEESPKQEKSTAAVKMLRKVYDAEFGFGAWPAPEEIEAVLKATAPIAASVDDSSQTD